ncbi:MAG TPA: septum formation initiator family protein [Chitinophagaceae bacterium]|nr:septum formation initiator family protein [Chitinophagaceae bacterium]MCC6635815.1 septum formation initiator family protein [Chitinophagaceae bacterium]HMZ46195.1 septum formation initiator family protein [Chitinophagaceae bacterium]HNE93637.1 septum formation initiator family protein [Chitinophagaceae bacterium]HNJ58371.1 septum formation initiator family protein [Chitinophagaceae bacterium]
MKQLPSYITNKYLLSILFFIAWMLFFDQKDFFSTIEKRRELRTLIDKNKYYFKEIEVSKKQLADFQSNSIAIEKFAREKYMLKKDNEDIYIIDEK